MQHGKLDRFHCRQDNLLVLRDLVIGREHLGFR